MLQRSQGAALLLRLGMTQETIAARTKIARPRISHYVTGKRKPGPRNRGLFERLFGIPVGAWDVSAAEAVLEPPASSAPVVPSPAALSVFALAGQLQRMALQQMEQLTTDRSATPHERSKMIRTMGEALNAIGKLTGETLDISEARLLRLPAWRRIQETIVEALRPWPEAMKALSEALEGLER